jgi:hypothetical protein
MKNAANLLHLARVPYACKVERKKERKERKEKGQEVGRQVR